MCFMPGILRDKTMKDKLMYILNYDAQNYPFCTTKLFVEFTNQDSIKVPKGCKPANEGIFKNLLVPV